MAIEGGERERERDANPRFSSSSPGREEGGKEEGKEMGSLPTFLSWFLSSLTFIHGSMGSS